MNRRILFRRAGLLILGTTAAHRMLDRNRVFNNGAHGLGVTDLRAELVGSYSEWCL